jgi:hypothetical protein
MLDEKDKPIDISETIESGVWRELMMGQCWILKYCINYCL